MPVRYQASGSTTILAIVREGLGITIDLPQPLQIGLAVRSQALVSRNAQLFVQTALAWTQGQASLPARAH